MANNRKSIIQRTKKLVFCALISGLGVVLIYLGYLTQLLDLSGVMFASLFNVIVVIEYGGGWPWAVYAVTGVLSLLLLPDKSSAVLYVIFAGYYPMLKEKLERLPNAVSWIIKFVVFNVALLITETVGFFILNVEFEGMLLEAALFAVGNVAFLIYDILLTRLITLYLRKWREKFKFLK